MELVQPTSVWDYALQLIKIAQQKNENPNAWAVQLFSYLRHARIDVPSPELAHLLVRHICFENHIPITWKLLAKSISCNLAPPLLVIALLSSRVIPNRRIHPSAYRLYLELLRRHVFSSSLPSQPHYSKIMEAIDESMGLSSVFDLQHREPGILFALFLFSTTWQLLDASLDDENLLRHTSDMGSIWLTEMTEEFQNQIQIPSSESHERLITGNTVMAIEIMGGLLTNRKTSQIIHLSRRNMPLHWGTFNQRALLLASQSSALNYVKGIDRETLMHLISDDQTVAASKKGSSLCPIVSQNTRCHGGSSSLWIPIDVFLENLMEGAQVTVSGALKPLIGLLRALQSVNNTSWHDAFLGLWISAIRLIQREREPSEMPMPRIDIGTSLLLSITPLAVASIVEDEESDEITQRKAHLGLITSLQQLGEFENLLTPPQSLSSLANQAAGKAVTFVSGLPQDPQVNQYGNLRHLIVDSCIARNLIDTSVYFWPGYVKIRPSPVPRSVAPPNGWSLLMKGSPLTTSLANALVTCPASSVSEVGKIYEIAIYGSEEEKILAGSILCGATLVNGWNIQEYTLLIIISLLCPRIPAEYVGNESHLLNHVPLLNVLLVGISSPVGTKIYSFHGLVPILATALLPICEVFGSLSYRMWTLPNGEELTSHAFFSHAFTLLLRLWRLDKASLEHVANDIPPAGTQVSPVFLMLVRNRQLAKPCGRMKKCVTSLHVDTSPVYIDSFPQLNLWYRQHVECIESAVPRVVPGTPVHQLSDKLLTMMVRRLKGTYPTASYQSSSSSSSTVTFSDEVYAPLKIPAWEILMACPFAVDAALTACSHGKLSPRELATGLKDLADFLPATLAAIVNYFTAEVTRGVWKPVPMNGTDWPSPAANLASVEEQIKKVLADTGVHVPDLFFGEPSQLTIPLPLAAFLSLTITYKPEKSMHHLLGLLGPYLRALASRCPWPCMPIVSALWIQKVKHWYDFLIYSASRTVFGYNNDALSQLVESCFTSALGVNTLGGAGGFLGHGITPPVAPGFLFVRVHGSLRNKIFLTEEVLSLLMKTVRRIADSGAPGAAARVRNGSRYREASCSVALENVRVAAAVGASMVWISGGLALVQSLMKEILPTWIISGSGGAEEGGCSVARLGGYAVANLAVLCGAFAWGIELASPVARRRVAALQGHMEFVACALEGRIAMGCHVAMTEAYVVGFISLVVASAPAWIAEVDAGLLRRLSIGLRRWNEDDLALHLLCLGGIPTMSLATDYILQTE